MTAICRKKEIHKGKCERREHAVSMRIVRLCYAVYLIGSSKSNFEQETLKSVLNGLDVGDMTTCREIFSTFNWGKNYESFMQIY